MWNAVMREREWNGRDTENDIVLSRVLCSVPFDVGIFDYVFLELETGGIDILPL